MDTARERARRRIVAFFQRDGAPTQEAFAQLVGYSQSWVSKILTRGPKLEDLDAIAAATGMSVADLVAPGDLIRHTASEESSHAAAPGGRSLRAVAEDLAEAASRLGRVSVTLAEQADALSARPSDRPQLHRKSS